MEIGAFWSTDEVDVNVDDNIDYQQSMRNAIDGGALA